MMGDPAGRTARHPTAAGAVGRSTERQRLFLAPPPAGEWVTVVTRKQAQRRVTRSVLLSVGLMAIGTTLMLWLANPALELLGCPFLAAGVLVAGCSRRWQRFRHAPAPEATPEPYRGTQGRKPGPW